MNLPLRTLSLLAMLPALASATVTLYQSNFTSYESATQQSGDFGWFWRSGSINADTGVMTVGTSNGHPAVGYFTAAAAPIRLVSVGDSIQVKGDFFFAGNDNGANRLQIGLFNSNGTRLSANLGSASTSTSFQGYTGFTGTLGGVRNNIGSIAADNSRMMLRLPGTTSDHNFLMSNTSQVFHASVHQQLVVGGPAYSFHGTNGLTVGTTNYPDILGARSGVDYTYTVNLILELIGSEPDGAIPGNTIKTVDMTFSYVGTSIGVTFSSLSHQYSISMPTAEWDTSGLLAFDTLGLQVASPFTSNSGWRDVTITHTAIPEPAHYAGLFGLAALALHVRRRLRRV